MSCRLDFLRIKLDQRCAAFDMISLSYKKFESVSSHVYRIDAYMDQNLHTICKCQAACVSGLGHYDADFRICRSYHCRVGRFNSNTVSHDFL